MSELGQISAHVLHAHVAAPDCVQLGNRSDIARVSIKSGSACTLRCLCSQAGKPNKEGLFERNTRLREASEAKLTESRQQLYACDA